MSRPCEARNSRASYLVGYLLLGTAALRAALFHQNRPTLPAAILLMAGYALLYATEPVLSPRFRWYRFVYFPLQTALILTVTHLRPFLDITCQLYIPLGVQSLHAFSRRGALAWMSLFALLLAITQVKGIGWADGIGLSLIMVGAGLFLISYELLYRRTRADQAKSQDLLAELEEAYRTLQAHAAQVEELAAVRERNRLARELHDSISQTIFSITLTAQAARVLLGRAPGRVPEQLDRLENMTGSALGRLRSLIARLHPPQKPDG